MVVVEVKTFAMLRSLLEPVIKLELEDNATVNDALNAIFKKYGEHVKERMINPETGHPHGNIKILKNGRNIDFLQGLNTPLKNGDELFMFPMVAGG